MEQKAVPLTRKVAAATGEGDPSFLKLDKQYTLVTSEDIVAAEMEQLLTSQGMEAAWSKSVSLLLMGYMNCKSKVVGPAQAPPQQQAASSQIAPVAGLTIDFDVDDEQLTEVKETDLEDEVRAANETDPKKMGVKKKTTKMTRKDKKAKAGAKADNQK